MLQKKIKLSNEEIANLSDAQFKTMIIRMLTEMVEYGYKKEEKVKAMKSELKKNVQGTNSDEKETRTWINSLEQKIEINIQPEQNEKTRIPKNEERLRKLQDFFKWSNIWVIEVPEREEEKQEMENLFENIMKENFPNLAKEINFQNSRKLRKSQRSWTQGSTHQGTS